MDQSNDSVGVVCSLSGAEAVFCAHVRVGDVGLLRRGIADRAGTTWRDGGTPGAPPLSRRARQSLLQRQTVMAFHYMSMNTSVAIASDPRPQSMTTASSGMPDCGWRRDHAVRELGPSWGGTIPTCAGTTQYDLASQGLTDGPSPPSQGPRGPDPQADRTAGAIPAYAGTTLTDTLALEAGTGHPRLRGDHHAQAAKVIAAHGPSPPARGARAEGQPAGGARRAIPACAGSTCRNTGGSRRCRGRPRLRGEHGSGAVVCAGQAEAIPACAGSTVALIIDPPRLQGHPCLRGEHANRAR
jgi:hypothetical protein